MDRPTRIRITVLRRFKPLEVFKEIPVTPHVPMDACEFLADGQQFLVEENMDKPVGFCTSAWVAMYPNLRALAFGGNSPWLKERGVCITCCSDGLRPVVFKLERV